jgi:hypothetical protein
LRKEKKSDERKTAKLYILCEEKKRESESERVTLKIGSVMTR